MDGTIIAAIIAASIAALTGVANICLSIHRNKLDGITTYRMQWINNMRDEFTKILSWNWYSQDSNCKFVINPIDDLQKSIYKVSLFLNVRDDYDQKILQKSFEYLHCARKTYESILAGNSLENTDYKMIMLLQSNNAFSEVEKIKLELQKLIRVYLKMEWTHVKVDCSINKSKYLYCWKPFIGFQPEKVIEKFSNEYKEYK